MKILFVYPDIGGVPHLSHGIAYLSAVLKEKGHVTDLCHLHSLNLAVVARKIQHFAPQLLAISSTTNQWHYTKEIAKFIKSKFGLPIFVGGAHPTVKPECIYESESIDGICRGEGELALLELVDKIERGQDYLEISNFWFRDKEKIIRNEIRPLIADLNQLPYPDRDLFDFNMMRQSTDYMRFMFSRGCPFKCSYCINPTLQAIYRGKGKYVRTRSVRKAIDEIKSVLNRYGFREGYVLIDDDTFGLDRRWLTDFCTQYQYEVKAPFVVNIRPDVVDRQILQLLKEAGCKQIRMGIESGNPYIRNEVLKRNISDEEIIDAFRLSREVGLETWAFNMIGIPEETPESFEQTIEMNRLVRPNRLFISFLYPYPGTDIEKRCVTQNMLREGKVVSRYSKASVLNLPTFPQKQMDNLKANFEFSVFKTYAPTKAVKYKIIQVVRRFPLGSKILALARALGLR